jgi:hypothetical protein
MLAPVLFLAQLAKQGLNLLDGLAAHGTGVDEHEIGFAKAIDERIPDTRKLRLNGVRIVLVHLTAECDNVRSHNEILRPSIKREKQLWRDSEERAEILYLQFARLSLAVDDLRNEAA